MTFTNGDGTTDKTMTFSGTLANINAALAGLVYTPLTNYNGNETLTINTNDGHGGTDSKSVAITVTSVNDFPTAINDVNTTFINSPVSGQVLTNDSDPDGNALTVTTTPVSGRVMVQ